ncbi:MAG: hypothetical protein AB7U20_16885 [Planctomycetaceae bacterium]
MQAQEIELSIGDCLQIGDHTVTIVDIEGDEVNFRIDYEEDFQHADSGGFREAVIPR